MKTFDVQIIYNREITAEDREEAIATALTEIERALPEAIDPDVIDVFEVTTSE